MSSSMLDGRVVLSPDGYGYNGYKKATPIVPVGTNRAIYVQRYWLDELTGVFSETGITGWKDAHFCGWNFTNEWIIEDGDSNSYFDEFLGVVEYKGVGTRSPGNEYFNSAQALWGRDYETAAGGGGFNQQFQIFRDGQNSNIWFTSSGSLPDADKRPYAVIAPNEAAGVALTKLFMAWTDSSDDRVYFRGWHNKDSVDLSAGNFAIATDLDPEDPFALFPVSDGEDTGIITINNDVAGTKWRPTTGTMAFPAIFECMRPFSTGPDFVIDYLGVHYSELA